MSYILGIDLSQWQGTGINWSQVKAAGYQFAIPRMTYAYPGAPVMIDPTASANYYGAKAAGLLVGGYHKVGWTSAIAEADAFISAMSPLAEGDILAYDIEPASDVAIPPDWATWEQSFVKHIHDRTGVWPLRYMNISMNNAMPAVGVVKNCAAWVAAPSYSWTASVPVHVSVTAQQGSTAHIPGVSQNVCDTNAFYGIGDINALRSQMQKLGYHSVKPTTTTTTVHKPVTTTTTVKPVTTTTTTHPAPATTTSTTQPQTATTTTANPVPPLTTTTTEIQTTTSTTTEVPEVVIPVTLFDELIDILKAILKRLQGVKQ